MVKGVTVGMCPLRDGLGIHSTQQLQIFLFRKQVSDICNSPTKIIKNKTMWEPVDRRRTIDNVGSVCQHWAHCRG